MGMFSYLYRIFAPARRLRIETVTVVVSTRVFVFSCPIAAVFVTIGGTRMEFDRAMALQCDN